jgi:hypothetical protein
VVSEKRGTANGQRRTEASGGRDMNNPVQVARSDTQLGATEKNNIKNKKYEE